MSDTVNGSTGGSSDVPGVDWQSFDSEGFLRRLVDGLGLSVAEVEFAARRLASNELARLTARTRIAMEEAWEQARLADQFDEDE